MSGIILLNQVQNDYSNFIYGEITTIGSLKVLDLLQKLSTESSTSSSSFVPTTATDEVRVIVQHASADAGTREVIYDLGSGEGLFCILAGLARSVHAPNPQWDHAAVIGIELDHVSLHIAVRWPQHRR